MDADASRTRCVGCGGLVPKMEGPTHRYMEASPGCWRVMDAATRTKERFHWLAPPASLGTLTVLDVADATPAEYPARVREWAESAWTAWAGHHATIRGWLPA